MCIVILSIVCPFCFSSSAAANNLSGSPYSNSYIPVCNYYPISSNLPYGDDTFCVCYELSSSNHDYYFFTDAYEFYEPYQAGITTFDRLGFFVGFGNTSDVWTLNIQSGSKIIHVREFITSQGVIGRTVEELGTYTLDPNATIGYYSLTINLDNPSDLTKKKIITNLSYCWGGFSGDQLLGAGVFSSVNDFVRPYYMAYYPDNVSAAIQSIHDNNLLLRQYYNSLSGKLNSLSSDHIILSNQNSELQSQVSELQSQLAASSGEYQSALNQAQSEIESNANAAASQAADDIINAGEDMSDIDNDVDDVNSIVETLDSWIETLDDFADRIQDTAADVASALDNGTVLFNGFLGVCPPIVLALFGFALVFLVVRKIIGR